MIVKLRCQDEKIRIRNVCLNCNKEFKKVINTVKFCSEKCEIAYVEKQEKGV